MRKKIIAILVLVSLINIAGVVAATDIGSAEHSSSTLTVTVTGAEPTIEWYNFTDSTGASKLDAKVDVGSVYNFTVRINDTNGWSDIQYVNITAWYDNGNDLTDNYNTTGGANLNMFLQYKNTTGTAEWSMLWPTGGEANLGTCGEVVIDDYTHNLTFRFTPGNQIRHTPGAYTVGAGWNWERSWNFNISVVDSTNLKAWVHDEYGIYRYTFISVSGSVTITGAPNENWCEAAEGQIDVTCSSNGNYSLYVHMIDPETSDGLYTLDNTTIGLNSTAAGLYDVHFTDSGPLYLYGSASTYAAHKTSGTSFVTDILYHCDIPLAQAAGIYNKPGTNTLTYRMVTQNA